MRRGGGIVGIGGRGTLKSDKISSDISISWFSRVLVSNPMFIFDPESEFLQRVLGEDASNGKKECKIVSLVISGGCKGLESSFLFCSKCLCSIFKAYFMIIAVYQTCMQSEYLGDGPDSR